MSFVDYLNIIFILREKEKNNNQKKIDLKQMKKVLFYVAAALIIVGAGIGIYLSVTNDKVDETLASENGVNVEQAISLDRETMFANYGGEYKWFETCIVLRDFMDEATEPFVTDVANIFQVNAKNSDGGYDTEVFSYRHTITGSDVITVDGWWIGDIDMCADGTAISFADAYARLQAANFVKPHSRKCTLRKAVGPTPCNPQFIFGNTQTHLFVDAITGDVTDVDPSGL